MIPVVSARELSVGYGRETVLDNVEFEVPEHEILIILGGSGCGKSTLLKTLIGLLPPLAGDALINGESIVNADWERKRQLMRGFGVLYQSGALFGSLTLGENVALPLEEYTDLSAADIRERVAGKLHQVDLDGYADYMPAELSGGMRKRAALARAMALDPKLLFFDEPSAGLDPLTSASLDKLILRVRDDQGTTMVIVSHELDSVFTVADRVIMLEKEAKGIVASGDPLSLRDNSDKEWVREFMTRAGTGRCG